MAISRTGPSPRAWGAAPRRGDERRVAAATSAVLTPTGPTLQRRGVEVNPCQTNTRPPGGAPPHGQSPLPARIGPACVYGLPARDAAEGPPPAPVGVRITQHHAATDRRGGVAHDPGSFPRENPGRAGQRRVRRPGASCITSNLPFKLHNVQLETGGVRTSDDPMPSGEPHARRTRPGGPELSARRPAAHRPHPLVFHNPPLSQTRTGHIPAPHGVPGRGSAARGRRRGAPALVPRA